MTSPLEDVLRDAASLLIARSGEAHRAAVERGFSVMATPQGGFSPLRARYPDGAALGEALRAGAPDVLYGAPRLLFWIDPEAGLRAARAVLDSPAQGGWFEVCARAAAGEALEAGAARLSLDEMIDRARREQLRTYAVAGTLARPELESSEARASLLERIAPETAMFFVHLREALLEDLLASDPPSALRFLHAAWSEPAHPYHDRAWSRLYRVGTPEALGPVASRLDALAADLGAAGEALGEAISAAILLDAERAADALIPHFLSAEELASPGGEKRARSILEEVTAALDQGRFPAKSARWIEAFAALLDRKALCDPARRALKAMDAGAVKKALAKRSPAPVPAAARPAIPIPPPGELHRRYEEGAGEAVWSELRALGDAVRSEPLEAEARAVARETMARLQANLEHVVGALCEGGYFRKKPKGAISTAKPDAAKKLDAIEKLLKGPLPLSVRAFYETFDAVSLAALPDEEPPEGASLDPELCSRDPLVIAPLAVVLAELKRQAADNKGYLPALQEPLTAPLGLSTDRKWDPDGAYADEYTARIEVPSAGADGVVVEEGEPAIAFTDYLRHYLAGGGFRGLSGGDDLARLTRDLKPF